jgi:hypothetical protein
MPRKVTKKTTTRTETRSQIPISSRTTFDQQIYVRRQEIGC